jgi:hypothetical protein
MGTHPADEVERSIARLALHDHVCVVYDTPEEQLRSIVPFVRMGIEGGDRCFYVADERTVETVASAMRLGGVEVDQAIRSGKLALATQRESYLGARRDRGRRRHHPRAVADTGTRTLPAPPGPHRRGADRKARLGYWRAASRRGIPGAKPRKEPP